MLSPHPEHQDAAHQLDLKSWTQQMMRQLEQDFGRRVDWFAVSHEHPEHRHVHVVAVSKQRLGVGQFRSMRDAGDSNVLSQQREQARQRDRERGAASLSRRDRMVVTGTCPARLPDSDPSMAAPYGEPPGPVPLLNGDQ